MIDKNEFTKLRQETEDFDEKREQVIQKSRIIIKISKQIIYSTHRNELKQAEKFIKDIEKDKKELEKIGTNLDTNMDRVAYQEYVEALCFYHFVKNNKLPSRAELKISADSYLLGLCDLSGELVRKAAQAIINKDFKKVDHIKDFVDELYGEFLKFNLRNSELRKKSDQIKWSLKKLEEVIFDAKLKGMIK
jgi:translin